jgi:hypothetical protein
MTLSRKFNAYCYGDWDNGDKFGSCMAWAFGCADALYIAGEDVPEEWQYQPGVFATTLHETLEDNWEAKAFTEMVEVGEFTWDDVRQRGNALLRYRDILEARCESS